MVEQGFAIHPGTESFFTVAPSVIHAEEAIHGISHSKRQCYLAHERALAYFHHYTIMNCFMECVANYTYNVRGIQFCPLLLKIFM